MHRIVLLITLLAVPTGCSQLFGLEDVVVRHYVGGHVNGLWNGTDGVTLRLEAEGVNTLLTVSADGAFRFKDSLMSGTSYAVTVMTSATQHTCIVDGGGEGVVAGADVTSISIACTGPAVVIDLSGPWGWTFDPTQEVQTFAGSIVAQDVTLTISGSSLTGASVDSAVVNLDEQTAPIALPLGSRMVPVTLTASGGLSKTYELIFNRAASVIDQIAYGKASNTGFGDSFGNSIRLSGDTLAVGARVEDSAARGVNTGQADNSANAAGAVYVFVRHGTTWIQQAYLKASNTGVGDQFGYSVSLFGDTLVVGAPGESSAATGVNGNQNDDSARFSGAVYVFVRNGTIWTQQAYLKASNTTANGGFGGSVSLFGDTLAVGAYVFVRNGTTWTQQAYLKAPNTGANGGFGGPVSLFGDTLAVGASSDSSAATGVNGDQTDDSAHDSGAVYVFVRNGTTWTQQAYLKASNTEGGDLFGDEFGHSVSLFGDTLAVGAINEGSAATGVNGNQADNSAPFSGAVYVFVRNGTTWTQQAYLKASNTGEGGEFGHSVSLFGDTLAVGAPSESSAATGVNGNQNDDSARDSGAVYVFVRNGTTWSQQAYLKASNTGARDEFGSSVSLFGDTLAVGAPDEASAAIGLNGNQADDSTGGAGAVYVFR